jgi:hypothetical protein
MEEVAISCLRDKEGDNEMPFECDSTYLSLPTYTVLVEGEGILKKDKQENEIYDRQAK